MTISMFSEYPDDVPPEIPEAPALTPRDATWALVRSRGKRITDHPAWHRIKVQMPEGAVMTLCGRIGSRVTEEVPLGEMIMACSGCVEATLRF